MPDNEKVIKGLRDIDMFIAGRLGYEKAKIFLRTIDEAVVLLKEQKKTRLEIAHEIIAESVLMYQGKELVRCKDCIHFGKKDKCIVQKYLSEHPEKVWLLSLQSDWFCADGKRED